MFSFVLFAVSLPADVKWMRDKRTPKDVCGEASSQYVGALFVPVYYVLSDVFRQAQLGTPKTQQLAQKSVN